jgi:hypothetical protein
VVTLVEKGEGGGVILNHGGYDGSVSVDNNVMMV